VSFILNFYSCCKRNCLLFW